MNVQQLAGYAINAINKTPKQLPPTLMLRLPGKWGASDKHPIVPGSQCVGDIVQEFSNEVTVIFDAIDLLAWCVANGAMVDVRYTE